MASTYSSNLKLELMGTGDQSGTWGDTTNTNLGTLLEQAIVGYSTQLITNGADTVLTISNGSSSVARNYILELTGALTGNRNLIVPAIQKSYIIYNNTSGGFAVTVKVSGQTGVTISNGKKAIVYNNGTDVIEVVNDPVTQTGTQTLTNKTLTAPIINGGAIDSATIGASTASSGAFTSLSASSTVSGTGFSTYLASPPAIGGTTASTVRGTTVTATTTFTGPIGAATPNTGAFSSVTVGGSTVGTNAFRNVTFSASAPTGGTDGDIWYQV